jgi:hypothetical protein
MFFDQMTRNGPFNFKKAKSGKNKVSKNSKNILFSKIKIKIKINWKISIFDYFFSVKISRVILVCLIFAPFSNKNF